MTRQETEPFTAHQIDLIERGIPLSNKLAQRAHRRHRYAPLDRGDLFQEGCIGLVKAVKKHNRARPDKFIELAYPYVQGSIIEALRRSSPLTRVERDKVKQWQQTHDTLVQKNARQPRTQEIAEAINLEPGDIDFVRASTYNQLPLSLDETVLIPDYSSESDEEIIRRIDCGIAIAALDPMEQKAIVLNVIFGFTQTEVAVSSGVNQMAISRAKSAGLGKIKAYDLAA